MMKAQLKRIIGQAGAAALLLLTLTATAGKKVEAPKAGNVTIKVEVDRNVLPAETATKAVVKVSLTAKKSPVKAKRTPVNLAIVLDRSGSMSGHKLEHAKASAIEMLKRLGKDDLFSLVVYESQVKTLVPAQSASNADHLIETISSIRSGGNTALFGGVSQGAAEVRKNLSGRYFHRIILLSDGLANVGPSTPADLERLGRALVKENISVTTVGVGNDYNEDLMTRLSQASDGNSYYVENSRDLPRIFQKELGDVLSVAAGTVTVEITCPDGVKPIRIIGREGSIKEDRAEVYLNQLYGGQEKYVLLEVEVPASRNKEKRRLADVQVQYKDLVQQSQASARGDVAVSFSTDEKAVITNVNKKVQYEVAVNDSSVLVDQSVEQMDRGEKGKAVSSLRGYAQKLRLDAKNYSNAGLAQQAEDMEKKAKKLEEEGLDKRTRKALKTDSYQWRNQQKQ